MRLRVGGYGGTLHRTVGRMSGWWVAAMAIFTALYRRIRKVYNVGSTSIYAVGSLDLMR